MELQISQMVLPVGRNLNGHKYTIINKIGEGGFSITYRARQNDLNRMVCIKEYFLYGRCVRDPRNFSVSCQPCGRRGLPRGGRAIIVGAVFGAKERMAGVNNLWITFRGDGTAGAGSHRRPGTIWV